MKYSPGWDRKRTATRRYSSTHHQLPAAAQILPQTQERENRQKKAKRVLSLLQVMSATREGALLKRAQEKKSNVAPEVATQSSRLPWSPFPNPYDVMHIIRGLDGVLISRIHVRQANAIVSALYRSNPANLRVFVDRALDKPSEATEGVPGAVNHPYNALGSMIQATGVISPQPCSRCRSARTKLWSDA
jgi:hypothetical protein